MYKRIAFLTALATIPLALFIQCSSSYSLPVDRTLAVNPQSVESITSYEGDFSFGVTADNRDAAGITSVLTEMKNKVGGTGLFHISTGDLDPMDGTYNAVRSVFGDNCAWFVVVGNHDIGSRLRKVLYWYHDYYKKAVRGFVKEGPAGGKDTTFSWNTGSAHFVVLNEYYVDGDDEAGDGDINDALYNWLAEDLANNSKPYAFVFGHEPAYPRERHVGDSLDKYPTHRDRFWQLLEDNNVTAYICGHTHCPSVFQPEGSSVYQIDTGISRGVAFTDDDKNAFLCVTVKSDHVTFLFYRDINKDGNFVLWKSWEVR